METKLTSSTDKIFIIKESKFTFMYFHFNTKIINCIKTVYQTKFDKIKKRWYIESMYFDQLIKCLQENNIEILIDDHSKEANKENEWNLKIQKSDNKIKISLPVPKHLFNIIRQQKHVRDFTNNQIIIHDIDNFYKICKENNIILID